MRCDLTPICRKAGKWVLIMLALLLTVYTSIKAFLIKISWQRHVFTIKPSGALQLNIDKDLGSVFLEFFTS